MYLKRTCLLLRVTVELNNQGRPQFVSHPQFWMGRYLYSGYEERRLSLSNNLEFIVEVILIRRIASKVKQLRSII